MRCKCCNRMLPPYRIQNEHKVEEDLCGKCLSVVYYEIVSEQYDVSDRKYAHEEYETPISDILPDVNK